MRAVVFIVVVALVVAASSVAHRFEPAPSDGSITLFSASQRGCRIVIPAQPIENERRAAEIVQATLARAAGRAPSDFPIVAETDRPIRRAIYVGQTNAATAMRANDAVPKPPRDTGVFFRMRDGALFLWSERRESIESAAGWFLEQKLGAHWFMPGELGTVVPPRTELHLKMEQGSARPGFVHRDLGVGEPGAREWYGRNRLEARFEHGHNLANIFKPEDFQRTPEMAPMRNGQRFMPAAGDQNWQPNMLSDAAVEHAATVANRAFAADPRRLSFALSVNDSVRFDESPVTLAAVAPPHFFRFRPDYSNLVFRFTNAVAARVAERHPDRWLPAYAYYWCENAPDFPIARNVVPFLTADRSRWSFPEFAAEDRALIQRWCRSGAEFVGVYDYLEGAPFLFPRPMLFAIAESIPFEFRAGVRAFYGEGSPNWALDGPKAWLAAQLLWSPERSPAELLDLYYREFWAEAAEPMRKFFAICEDAWQHQPGPPLWLHYYQDEDQSYIFTADQLAALQSQLQAAAMAAHSPEVRARVEFAVAGFSVSEAFAEFCAARHRVHRLARAATDPEALASAWQAYAAATDKFAQRFKTVRRKYPLALAEQDLAIYFRNQPDSRVARELARTEAGRTWLREHAKVLSAKLGATEAELGALFTRGTESLNDPAWQTVTARPVASSATLEWTPADSAWRGSGEPWEGRSVELKTDAAGQRVLRFVSCRTEGIGQWIAATPNALYGAKVNVRARSSPGTATFLIVSFLDENNRHLGIGTVDRLPADASADQETELSVVVRAPANARFVGFGVRALNQINDDFAEFSGASLLRWVE